MRKKYKNNKHAGQLVEAVVKSRRKLSNRRLNNEKYNLIKIIKESYDIKEFFNTRIPNFKVMASIYKVFGIGDKITITFIVFAELQSAGDKITVFYSVCGAGDSTPDHHSSGLRI